jgi:hypothetical protein
VYLSPLKPGVAAARKKPVSSLPASPRVIGRADDKVKLTRCQYGSSLLGKQMRFADLDPDQDSQAAAVKNAAIFVSRP